MTGSNARRTTCARRSQSLRSRSRLHGVRASPSLAVGALRGLRGLLSRQQSSDARPVVSPVFSASLHTSSLSSHSFAHSGVSLSRFIGKSCTGKYLVQRLSLSGLLTTRRVAVAQLADVSHGPRQSASQYSICH